MHALLESTQCFSTWAWRYCGLRTGNSCKIEFMQYFSWPQVCFAISMHVSGNSPIFVPIWLFKIDTSLLAFMQGHCVVGGIGFYLLCSFWSLFSVHDRKPGPCVQRMLHVEIISHRLPLAPGCTCVMFFVLLFSDLRGSVLRQLWCFWSLRVCEAFSIYWQVS